MKNNHIILYASEPISVSRAIDRGFTTKSIDKEVKMKVTVEKTDQAGLAKLKKKNPEILATAPAIPMKLIRPFKKTKLTKKDIDKINWGVEAVKADKSAFTGKSVKVAILDTGIDKAHPAFKGIKITEEDFTNEGNGDVDGHGTHCAGTVFGRDVNGTRIGIARGIDEVLIGKVIGKDGGASDMMVQAIQWAVKSGAHVISMSLGIDFPGYVKELQRGGMKAEVAASIALEGYRKNILLFEKMATLVRTQAETEFSQPVIIVAAAGNESDRPDFEIAVSPPAVSGGFISVGALGKNKSKFFVANFSNSGPILSAPGVDILSAEAGKTGLVSMDGTSMATPHVAGIAALWAEKMISSGGFNLGQFEVNLRASCTQLNLPKNQPNGYGAGMVQAPFED